MPFTRRQEELWRTTALRHFPPPLPKVRKQHDAGTAVGPRTDIQEPGAARSGCRPRSATVRLESKRHRCRIATVLRRLAKFEYSTPMHFGFVFEIQRRPMYATAELCCLTFELSGRQRQDARPGLVKMYRVPPARAWWPAVGAPLERGVRPHLRRLGKGIT